MMKYVQIHTRTPSSSLRNAYHEPGFERFVYGTNQILRCVNAGLELGDQ